MGTSGTNGRLWGARARDWAEVQEGQCAAAFQAVLDHAGAGPGTRHLDVGCGAGMAAALSAGRGAAVSGLDAAEALLEIARERTPGGDFRLGDVEALPFEDDAFDVDTHWSYPDEATALRGLGSAGVAVRAIEHAGAEAFVAAHRAALAPFRQPDGGFRIGARFRCLVAAP
ncbi:class I SAM-dependent methyltransferase [Neoroseomonas rubea]|uniref:class I SAM-dependent methyltransferase n=1 Tax=Neoroseomonas rubea TaxID=2748666 RepID=UPI0018E03909|nr:methyltransferase domain-containing protein [Roseomonas rubea]